MTGRKRERAEAELADLAQYQCNDCGVNVVTAGEFYMLKPQIWEDELGLSWDDNLCVGCLENRLGRKVTLHDMGSFPAYKWMQPPSDRLRDRLGFEKGRNGKWHHKRQVRARPKHIRRAEARE
jgi:hypothetical protein